MRALSRKPIPSPRVTLRSNRYGVFVGKPRKEAESQPTLVVRKNGRDALILSLGKRIRPRDTVSELTNAEIKSLRKAILMGIDSVASKLPVRRAYNRYLIVGRKRGLLARRNGGEASLKKVGYEVPPGLRVVIPRSAQPLVRYFDEIVRQSMRTKHERQIRRTYRIRKRLISMFQRAPDANDLFRGKQARHVTNREDDIVAYLQSIPYIWKNPAYLATVLNGIRSPIVAGRIVDRMYQRNDPVVSEVKERIRANRSIRNVPKPKELEWFIRGFYRKDPLFRHYDIFPRRVPTLDPELPF